MDNNLRGSIIDSIIAEGRKSSIGVFRRAVADQYPNNGCGGRYTDSRVSAFQNFGTQHVKECAHVRLCFDLTASSHVTQNILLCRQRQLFRASPKKQSTCIGSLVGIRMVQSWHSCTGRWTR